MSDAAGRERELFEKWATSYNWNVMTNSDGYFHSPIVDMAWFVWQAARAPSGLAGRQQTTEQDRLLHTGSAPTVAAARDETPE